jgi:hypothetical protein
MMKITRSLASTELRTTESGPLGLPSAARSSLGIATTFSTELSGAQATKDRSFHSRFGAGGDSARKCREISIRIF